MTENPWRGKILTVWNLPPDPADLIAAGHALGLDGFEIKVADGNSSWLDSPSRHVTRAYCDALRAAGFRVLGWSYNYCDGLVNAGDRGDGIPEEEAAAAARGVAELALEGHTFDLEIECEGHADLVEILLEEARHRLAHGTPIGAHVWADLAGHAEYPAAEIVARVDCLRPMIYRPVWTARRFYRSWEVLLEGRPDLVVCPEWGITEGTAPELLVDLAYADERGIPGEGYWEWSAVAHLRPAVRELIAGRSFAAPAPPPYDVDAARTRLWGEADALEAAGWPWFAAGVKAAVAQSKGDR